jgi:negative elongation factor C/D
VIRRLQQEVQKQATRANHDVTPITMALMAGFQHSKAAHNLSSMLSKDSLNPADIVQLHRSVCFCVCQSGLGIRIH